MFLVGCDPKLVALGGMLARLCPNIGGDGSDVSGRL